MFIWCSYVNTKCRYWKISGYGIGFDRRSIFSIPGGGFVQNVLILGVNMRSSSHIDNKKKDILVLGKGLYPRRLWNTGLVSSGDILTSWGEGASLALVGNPSSDGVTIKMPYGVYVIHRPASHPIFSYWFG